MTNRILENLQVFDGQRIREIIRRSIQARTDMFLGEHCYITSFGASAKSGEVILYEFRNAADVQIAKSIIEPWKISQLPAKSRIVFVDDLIGTGRQSLKYIDKLRTLLSPSHQPCLFSLCGTPTGINAVKNGSTFDVLCAVELNENEFNHYNDYSSVFNAEERGLFKRLNQRLGQSQFDMGLLVAFYYSTPNNTMPFLWKEGANCSDQNGQREEPWFALLPRKY